MSRSSDLSRLGKVINKLGWAVDADKVYLDMGLFMTNIHIHIHARGLNRRVIKVGYIPREQSERQQDKREGSKDGQAAEVECKVEESGYSTVSESLSMEKEHVKYRVQREERGKACRCDYAGGQSVNSWGENLEMILYSVWDENESCFIVSVVDEDLYISERKSAAFLFAGDAIQITANGGFHFATVDEKWMLDRFWTFINFKCRDYKELVEQEFDGQAYILQMVGPFGMARYVKRKPCLVSYADGSHQTRMCLHADPKLNRMVNINCAVDDLAVTHIGSGKQLIIGDSFFRAQHEEGLCS